MKQQRYIIFGLLVLAVVLAVTQYSHIYSFLADRQPGANGREGENIFAELGSVALETLDGETVMLDQYAGRPLVLNSWATWCPFCKDELPAFAAIQREYQGEVLFIAINRGESNTQARRYIDASELEVHLLFLQDPRDDFYDAIGGFSMPETLFINEDGMLVEHKRGPLDEAQTRERVEQIL